MSPPADGTTTGLPVLKILDALDLERLLDWTDLLDVVQTALARPGGAMRGMQVPVGDGALHIKGGVAEHRLCLKANLRGVVPGRVTGILVLFDLDQAAPVALVDSGTFTAIRTAAVAAVAARLLAPSTPLRVAILGLGPLGRRCLDALPQAVDVARWSLWNRTPIDPTTVPKDAPSTLHTSPTAAVSGCDLVVTCTAATEPLLDSADLPHAATVLALGADTPGKRELTADVLARSSLIVDDLEALVRGEASQLAEHRHGPRLLAEVIAGTARPARHDGTPTVFDSVGSAMVDAHAAGWFIEQAQRRRVGGALDLTGSLARRHTV